MRLRAGFSLLEVAVVIMIVGILTVLAVPGLGKLKARAQRIQCMTNLKSLHVAAEMYVQDNNQWPQIKLSSEDDGAEAEYAQEWITALAPYKVTNKTFICPSVENLLGNPDFTATANVRTDYVATTFDDKPTTPHQWPRQPWFAEIGDVHGNGNLIIFTDGSISDLKTITANPSK